ncbi:TPM domain-containing protein [Micrococcus porci]|uniref:TPM domain-containing protein n=1 Tax=Micrococcus TaxID=1269 RepID=UPI001CCFEDF7|nr:MULTISPECIES: TPM domain-containing protein [Micrococcus]MCG7423370.1 TPM domain-containing protein [Micrococcus sp. ACRRV]UBH23585.1 TPM domain-containing protein [Micrococcus porci]
MAESVVRPSAPRLSRAAVLGGLGAITTTALLAPGAHAAVDVPPGTFVVDQAEVLSSAQESELTQDITQLQSKAGQNLYVVYVDKFDSTPQATIDSVVQQRGLGNSDSVLAIAVENRNYGFDTGMSSTMQSDIRSAYILPALRKAAAGGDWEAPAVAAVQGLDDAANGTLDGRGRSGETYQPDGTLPQAAEQDSSAQTSTSDSGNGASGALVGAGALAAVAGGAYVVSRRRRKSDGGAEPGAVATGPQASRDPLDELSVDELRKRAGATLVAADDAIRSSEQEVGFAMASYGEGAVGTFRQDIEKAKEHMRASFQLQHQLDDEIPDTEADQRSWLKEIIARSEQVGATLAAHKKEFDSLRDLENSVPEAISALESRVPQAEGAVQAAERELVDLHGRYAESALTEVNDNATQARERLEFVKTAEAKARASLEAGDRSTAAVAVRAAEESLSQVGTLTEAVSKAGAALSTHVANLQMGISQSEQDLAEAQALLSAGRNPELAGPVGGMQQTLAAVRAELQSGRPDPLALLQRLESAHRQLNTPLSGVRDAREQARQAEQMLSAAISQAQAQIDGTADFIGARRGAVGSEARTRLAEADRSLQTAMSLRSTDPVAALDHAQRASQLADRASERAQQDVADFGYGGMGGYGGLGGGYAGAGYRGGYGMPRSGAGGGFAGGLGGALLGGILMNSMFGGHHHDSGFGGGDWGGGGFGGFGGGGLDGGDFGGFGDADFGGF